MSQSNENTDVGSMSQKSALLEKECSNQFHVSSSRNHSRRRLLPITIDIRVMG